TNELVAAGRHLFFTQGADLWVTDGTESGTHALPATFAVLGLTPAGDRVVFTSSSDATGYEPWVSDGTAEGTHLLRDIYPGPIDSLPSDFATIGDVAYFAAWDDVRGAAVWVTDGTPQGTAVVSDVDPNFFLSSPGPF